MTHKSSQDRGQNGVKIRSRYRDPKTENGLPWTLRLFLLIVSGKTFSLVGEDYWFTVLGKAKNMILIGQGLGVKGDQSDFDTKLLGEIEGETVESGRAIHHKTMTDESSPDRGQYQFRVRSSHRG